MACTLNSNRAGTEKSHSTRRQTRSRRSGSDDGHPQSGIRDPPSSQTPLPFSVSAKETLSGTLSCKSTLGSIPGRDCSPCDSPDASSIVGRPVVLTVKRGEPARFNLHLSYLASTPCQLDSNPFQRILTFFPNPRPTQHPPHQRHRQRPRNAALPSTLLGSPAVTREEESRNDAEPRFDVMKPARVPPATQSRISHGSTRVEHG
jgi:hypothetical protein